MKYLSIIICSIVILSSTQYCLSYSNIKNAEIVNNQSKTEEPTFNSCGKNVKKGCSKSDKKKIKSKSGIIRKK